MTTLTLYEEKVRLTRETTAWGVGPLISGYFLPTSSSEVVDLGPPHPHLLFRPGGVGRLLRCSRPLEAAALLAVRPPCQDEKLIGAPLRFRLMGGGGCGVGAISTLGLIPST